MGCAMPQEEQLQPQQQSPSSLSPSNNRQMETLMSTIDLKKTDNKLAVQLQRPAVGKLKGSHSALVKLLESAPVVEQVGTLLKHQLSGIVGEIEADQNHYRKGELGTSKCPWKKSRICAEWLLKNQKDIEKPSTDRHPATDNNPTVMINATTTNAFVEDGKQRIPKEKTDTTPKYQLQSQLTEARDADGEDVDMVDMQSQICTCQEVEVPMCPSTQSQGESQVLRRNSNDSTDDDELSKCGCSHCTTTPPLPPLKSQQTTRSVSDSGCEDSDCAENKITDLCHRFNENLVKDDVRS